MMLSADLVIRKVTTLRRLAPAERNLAFSGLAVLATVRIALCLLPFHRVMRLFRISGVRRPVHGGCTPQQVAWAVRLASRYLPGATCLPRALTTQFLLNRHGHPSRLCVGVSSAQKFEAHAWVECDGIVVVGGTEKLDRFASILTLNTWQS
jgi:hypothetical protein